MSDSPSSSTILHCSNSKINIKELKQSVLKKFFIDASIKLNSKDKITDADVQVISEEASSNNTNLPFSDKENKKCLFPTLKIGSFKKAKAANSTPNSVSEEMNGFLQEENLTSDLIFKNANL